MHKREAMFGFGGLILGFAIATLVLMLAEKRVARAEQIGNSVHAAHLASILHDGRLEPLSTKLEQDISRNIQLLDDRKLSPDDVHALRAVDKICRTRGIVLTAEANAVLVKNGARPE